MTTTDKNSKVTLLVHYAASGLVADDSRWKAIAENVHSFRAARRWQVCSSFDHQHSSRQYSSTEEFSIDRIRSGCILQERNETAVEEYCKSKETASPQDCTVTDLVFLRSATSPATSICASNLCGISHHTEPTLTSISDAGTSSTSSRGYGALARTNTLTTFPESSYPTPFPPVPEVLVPQSTNVRRKRGRSCLVDSRVQKKQCLNGAIGTTRVEDSFSANENLIPARTCSPDKHRYVGKGRITRASIEDGIEGKSIQFMKEHRPTSSLGGNVRFRDGNLYNQPHHRELDFDGYSFKNLSRDYSGEPQTGRSIYSELCSLPSRVPGPTALKDITNAHREVAATTENSYMFIPYRLARLWTSSELCARFRPAMILRDVRNVERGHWDIRIRVATTEDVTRTRQEPSSSQRSDLQYLLHDSGSPFRSPVEWEDHIDIKKVLYPDLAPVIFVPWTFAEFSSFFEKMKKFVSKGQAGIGVRLTIEGRESEGESIRVHLRLWSWGEALSHLWMVMLQFSGGLIETLPLEWTGSEGRPVIRMTGQKQRSGNLGSWMQKGRGEQGCWGMARNSVAR